MTGKRNKAIYYKNHETSCAQPVSECFVVFVIDDFAYLVVFVIANVWATWVIKHIIQQTGWFAYSWFNCTRNKELSEYDNDNLDHSLTMTWLKQRAAYHSIYYKNHERPRAWCLTFRWKQLAFFQLTNPCQTKNSKKSPLFKPVVYNVYLLYKVYSVSNYLILNLI